MTAKYSIRQDLFTCVLDHPNAPDKGIILYRIQAERDFGDVKKGDLGGYVQSEENLAQQGNCWIYEDSMVYEQARVSENATIRYGGKVHGHARVYGNASVFKGGEVMGRAAVYGNASVSSLVLGSATVRDNAKVCDGGYIGGDAIASGRAKISGNSVLKEGECKGYLPSMNLPHYGSFTLQPNGKIYYSVLGTCEEIKWWMDNYKECSYPASPHTTDELEYIGRCLNFLAEEWGLYIDSLQNQ